MGDTVIVSVTCDRIKSSNNEWKKRQTKKNNNKKYKQLKDNNKKNKKNLPFIIFTENVFKVRFNESQTIGVNSILQFMQGFIIWILVFPVKLNPLLSSETLPLFFSYV